MCILTAHLSMRYMQELNVHRATFSSSQAKAALEISRFHYYKQTQ
jgi:hypothetical protein